MINNNQGNKRIWYGILLYSAVLFIAVYHKLFLCKEVPTHDAIIWYGSFHYYIDSILSGFFPYWDPYMQTGTYFYPNISIYGLLDPTVLLSALPVGLFGISPVTVYVYFRLFRFLIFLTGAYLFFNEISRHRISSLLSAVVLMFALAPSYFRQNGTIDLILYTPLILFAMLRFMENRTSPQRYKYLALAMLLTGITMNIFIPAYFLFNAVLFFLMLFAVRVYTLSDLRTAFQGKKTAVLSVTAVIVILLMSAPPLMVMYRDASGGGELFPMLRIIHKNDGKFKAIMATEVGEDVLSERFTGQKGVFASYGNFVNLLYPDIAESIPYFADDLLTEIEQYIGILPFIIAILGLMTHTSKFRRIAIIMMVIITLNMFSFAGVTSKPFNAVQKFFNIIFPPLSMVEVRESFGSFFLLYLCLLLSLGLSIIMDRERLIGLLKQKYRQITGVCLGIVLLKIVITGYYADKAFFVSYYDFFILFQLIACLGAVYAIVFGRLVINKAFYFFIIALVSVDFSWYSAYNFHRVLGGSETLYQIAEESRIGGQQRDFQYFREPVVFLPGLAFGESILKVKGVLTYGDNHTIFTTKRYYDLLTNIPLQQQLSLSGVVYPIVSFFPSETVMTADSAGDVFNRIKSAPGEQIHQELMIEKSLAVTPQAAAGLKALLDYDDVSALTMQSMFYANNDYINKNGQLIELTRNRLNSLLNTALYTLKVEEFSPNDIIISVKTITDGYLYYADGWSKYWQAFDNGKEIPVFVANYNSKAVFLDKGDHLVRFVFNPRHYRIGLAAYYAGLVISIGIIIFLLVKNRNAVL